MDRQSLTYAIVIPLILLLLVLRIWRGSKGRRLRVERMWIRPVIIGAFIASSIAGQPPPMDPISLGALAAAGVAGFAFGWWRGRMVRISIDVESHALTSQQSPWALLIFVGLMLGRIGIRFALRGDDDFNGIPVAEIVDAVTLFYGGNILGMQLEMWLRARKLLADTIAAKAAGKATPAEVTQEHA